MNRISTRNLFLIICLFLFSIENFCNGQYMFTSEGKLQQPAHGVYGHVCCNCTDSVRHQFLQQANNSPQRLTYPVSALNPNVIASSPDFSDDRSAIIQGQAAYPNVNTGIPSSSSPPNINVMQNANGVPENGIPVASMNDAITFKLFSRESPVYGEQILVHDKNTLATTKYLMSRPTKIILHGFGDASEEKIGDWVTAMKQAFLTTSDVNILVVNFSYFKGFLFFSTNLPLFTSSKLADMILFLEQQGANLNDIHLIGRSWGAHVAGIAGRMLKGRLGRISGLEPAGPSTNLVSHEFFLDFSDAKLVDIIHVNGKRYFFHGTRFGLVPPTGHVDIYPNYAEKAYGCPDENKGFKYFSFQNCKAGRGIKYFVDAIQYAHVHPMCNCPSFHMYKSGECYCQPYNTISLGQISNQTIGVFQLAASPTQNLLLTRTRTPPVWG